MITWLEDFKAWGGGSLLRYPRLRSELKNSSRFSNIAGDSESTLKFLAVNPVPTFTKSNNLDTGADPCGEGKKEGKKDRGELRPETTFMI